MSVRSVGYTGRGTKIFLKFRVTNNPRTAYSWYSDISWNPNLLAVKMDPNTIKSTVNIDLGLKPFVRTPRHLFTVVFFVILNRQKKCIKFLPKSRGTLSLWKFSRMSKYIQQMLFVNRSIDTLLSQNMDVELTWTTNSGTLIFMQTWFRLSCGLYYSQMVNR